MKYNITKNTPPAMPKLGKGTECITLLLSQVSKDIQQIFTPMHFSPLGAHISGAEIQYPDLSWKETSGMLADIVAESSSGKGKLSALVEAICRDIRQHDDEELTKLVEWQKMMKTKSANNEKPARPDVAFWFRVSRKEKNKRKSYPIARNVLQRTTDICDCCTFANVITELRHSPNPPDDFPKPRAEQKLAHSYAETREGSTEGQDFPKPRAEQKLAESRALITKYHML